MTRTLGKAALKTGIANLDEVAVGLANTPNARHAQHLRHEYNHSRAIVVYNRNVFSCVCVYHILRCMMVCLHAGTPAGGDSINGDEIDGAA